MKLRVVLINPWIYDFAAYNLWSRPLGLLKVAEYLSAFDVELSLIDCTASYAPGRYGAGKFRSEAVGKPEQLKNVPRIYKRYGIRVDEFTARLSRLLPADLILMTSVMSYWYPGVQSAVELVRDCAGSVPIVLGGIYATLYHEHALENTDADFIYRGGVGEGLKFALYTFGFRPKRKRDIEPYYRLGLYDARRSCAPLLTSTGCPFACSYCAAGLLAGGHRRRPAGDVLAEIAELHALGARDFAFYDDALLFDADRHIKPILRHVVRTGGDARFHAPNGIHARFVDEELARLMRMAGFRTVRLGLETVDVARQGDTGGKVGPHDLERAVALLRNEGFTREELGVYLMYGLPGQPMGEVAEGVAFLKSLGVRIHLTEFSPIKGTRSWGELEERGVVDSRFDPLLTNNTVYSYLYSGYDPGEVEKMKLDVKRYNESGA